MVTENFRQIVLSDLNFRKKYHTVMPAIILFLSFLHGLAASQLPHVSDVT